MKQLKFIDLFCGIGGFHYAMHAACQHLDLQPRLVFASDIDPPAQDAYELNLGTRPAGDITKIDADDIPAHDILLGGFPCQAFSIIGDRKGFEDTRGTLFFDIARILERKRPKGFVLENVKQLSGHDGGRTLKRIISTLESLGYETKFEILNALDFGLPQKRERIFIVGWERKLSFDWAVPEYKRETLSRLLQREVNDSYYASQNIRERRQKFVKVEQLKTKGPTIWHENKSGNISAYNYSCALRAGASYNYLLVNGERRLTEREMLRLQGFPDSHTISHSYSTMRRFAGNALPIPIATAVIFKLLDRNLKVKNATTGTKAKASRQD